MRAANPIALFFVGLCTCVGALAGSWLIGLTVGLAVPLVIEVLVRWQAVRDPLGEAAARRRAAERRRRRG